LNRTEFSRYKAAGPALVVQALILAIAAPLALADVKLPAVIGDNMVLQRHQCVPIWGSADPGENVTVTFDGQKASTQAGKNGKWLLGLTTLAAGGPHEMIIEGNNRIKLTNVMVGEVWMCSGQSNMVWPVQRAQHSDTEIAAANYPNIRLFSVQLKAAEEPLPDTVGAWVACSPETIPGHTAVGYFFGRGLHKELNVPIGLINSSWGGTTCEAWTSRPGLEWDPDFRPILNRGALAEEHYLEQTAEHHKSLAEWEKAVEKAKADGTPLPPAPVQPLFERRHYQPGGLYNGMIAPIIPYAIRGVIWYQGEANVGRAYQYRKLFPNMIRDWRLHWGGGAFPFLFVQLANFTAVRPEPGDSTWAELREAQSMTLSLRNTGQAVIIDIGEAADIHPKNKQDVGKRLSLIALAKIYGKDIVFSGPMYKSMVIEGDSIRLRFDYVGGGLVAKEGGPLNGFAVAGEDRKFVWAEATIDGSTVVVGNDAVARPVAVRYAWANNPVCNLYNTADLPASPFRTDDWPGVTADKW